MFDLNSDAEIIQRVQDAVDDVLRAHPHQSIVLDCGGTTEIAPYIASSSTAQIIDPVVAALHMCLATVSGRGKSVN